MHYEVAAARKACFACRAPSTTVSHEPRSAPLMDVFRQQIWKIVVLFIAAFAGMLLPIAVGVVL